MSCGGNAVHSCNSALLVEHLPRTCHGFESHLRHITFVIEKHRLLAHSVFGTNSHVHVHTCLRPDFRPCSLQMSSPVCCIVKLVGPHSVFQGFGTATGLHTYMYTHVHVHVHRMLYVTPGGDTCTCT